MKTVGILLEFNYEDLEVSAALHHKSYCICKFVSYRCPNTMSMQRHVVRSSGRGCLKVGHLSAGHVRFPRRRISDGHEMPYNLPA